MVKERFAKRLKDALYALGITQKELAKRIGVNPVTVSRYLSGGQFPDPELIPPLCRALKVSSDWLFGLEGENDSMASRAAAFKKIARIVKEELRE